MRLFYAYAIQAMWAAFLLYWQLAGLRVKAVQRMEPTASRMTRVLLFMVALGLLLVPLPLPWINMHFYTRSLFSFSLGGAITLMGLLFSIWARVHLGQNWSRSVTIKKDHELIVSGPYALVRHPIYTGLLIGFLGTAVVIAQVRGLVAFALVFIALWFKLRMEERWMRSQFGESYRVYAQRVSALVPFVL